MAAHPRPVLLALCCVLLLPCAAGAALRASPLTAIALARHGQHGAAVPVPLRTLQFAALGAKPAVMPLVGFGTCSEALGCPMDANNKTQVTANVERIQAFLEEGGRMLDTATLYNTHLPIRIAMKQSGVPRTEVFISTKIHYHTEGHDNPAAVRAAVKQSLKELDTSYLDMVMLHEEYAPVPTSISVLKTLTELQKEGLVRHIGVANFRRATLEAVHAKLAVYPAVHQFRFNPWAATAKRELVSWCKARGIQPSAYWSLQENTWHRDGGMMGEDPSVETKRQAALTRIAAAHHATVQQVLLRFALDEGVAVNAGATSRAHIKDNLKVSHFQLTKQELSDISQPWLPQQEKDRLENMCPDALDLASPSHVSTEDSPRGPGVCLALCFPEVCG